MKFIDPRIDFAFKKIFGSEDAKDILISFLESLLGLEGERCLAEVTIMDPFLAPRIRELKYSILDVRCRDQRGVTYIVEMQVQKVAAFLKRIQYNAAKAYVHQIGQGEEYPKLNQVIAVTITDFPLFDGFTHCVSRHESRETVSGHAYLLEILHYFIELPKFTKPLGEISDVLDQWIYFIKWASSLDSVPEQIRVIPIRHAFEKAMLANMTPDEMELYDKAGIAITDAKGAVELAREEGEARGEARGERKGKADVLLSLVRRKFGAQPDRVRAMVESADLATLETWTDRILDANTQEEVFASPVSDPEKGASY